MGFAFTAHIALLEQFLTSREAIAGSLERRLFSASGRAAARDADRDAIAEIVDASFFESPAVASHLSVLNGQLEAARRADGFVPARHDGYSRQADPAELVLRACHWWDSGRWPGRNGRLVFAQGLYALFVLRLLEQLSLRIWDEGHEQAARRLEQVQRLLDVLNEGSAPDIRMVRDARWLIQTAQGPLTTHVKPYFVKAENVSALQDDALEMHKAGAVLAGGHLRSQLRHLSQRTGWAFDDLRLLALTRSSNSMDMALLVRDLAPLLAAYASACVSQDVTMRIALSDAILQGLSADPELLLTRLDLLEPSTMIEDLFVERDDAGAARYTAMGESHREHLARYGELVARTAEWLWQDSRALDPAHTSYSPLGIVYGFCADLFSNMVLNTLRPAAAVDVSVEEMFISGEPHTQKRARANAWAELPKQHGERDPFEHSTAWASRMFARLGAALEARAARPGEPNASAFRTSQVYTIPRGMSVDAFADGMLPAGIVRAQEHCLTSDAARARETGATLMSADRMAADRAEGRFLACVHYDGAWFGISKVPLTLMAGRGTDVLFTDVPHIAIDVLQRVWPGRVVGIDRR